ncbi:MAG: GHKL domain-containing protein [Lachnospiraceae bacterium]|nr:GHKL domain-containing protein [Lachnospiraceae bacterium]
MVVVGILIVFVCFLDLAANIQAAKIFLDYKIHNYKIVNMLLILLFSVPSVFLELELATEYRPAFVIVYYLGHFLIYPLIYKKLNLKTFYVFLFTINTPQMFMNIVHLLVKNKPLATIIAFLLDAVMWGSVLYYIKKKKCDASVSKLANSLPVSLYIIILVLTYIASLFIMGIDDPNKHKTLLRWLIAPSTVGLIMATVLIVRVSISEAEKRASIELLSKQVENQIAYYEKINKIYDEFRSFRHDFKNHVLCLRGFISANRIDDAVEYMNEMIDMASSTNKQYNTGNIIIDALLNDKNEKAAEVNSKLEYTGNVPNTGITNADLCIIMANAIDNAIEACGKDSSDDTKIIQIESKMKQGYFFFKISNPIFEEIVINEKKKIMTSKKDKEHHGLGISNILNAVKRYDGEAEISTENEQFVLDIQLLLKSA